jgi:alpha-L-fucosidase 2
MSLAGVAGAEENIFAVDGNTAATAGIAEMLLQSAVGYLELLPALPAAWPSGHVQGLRTRGGFEVDLAWQEGALVTARIYSLTGHRCRIRSERPLCIASAEAPERIAIASSIYEFETHPGASYQITPI